jgi:hypothetical protein
VSTTPAPKSDIAKVAEEVQELLIRHIEGNTAEDDARREAERDARVAAALRELAEEGKLPPKRG